MAREKKAGLNASRTEIPEDTHVESVETQTKITEGRDGIMEVETEVDVNVREEKEETFQEVEEIVEEVMEEVLEEVREPIGPQFDYGDQSSQLKKPLDIRLDDEIHQVMKVPVRDELDDRDVNKTTVMTYGINSIKVNALHLVKVDGDKCVQVNGDIDLPVKNNKPSRDPLDNWYVDLNAAKYVWRGLMETEVKHARKEEKAAIKVRSYMEDQLKNERF